jgi:hypothetical protein
MKKSILFVLAMAISTTTFIPTSAFAVPGKLVQKVSVDLDADGKPDTVAEYNVGKAKNVLRISLSKGAKTFTYGNILPNPNFSGNNPVECHAWQDNVLKVIPAESEERSDGEMTGSDVRVLVRMQKGANNGCDTGYSFDRTDFFIGAYSPWQSKNSVLTLAKLQRKYYAYAHHDCEFSSAISFTGNAVEVKENKSYHKANFRSIGEEIEQACDLSLETYEKAGAVPACAQAFVNGLQAKLWPQDERGDENYCRPDKL